MPRPPDKRIAMHLTAAAERALRSGHPWLFADSITRQSRNGRSGDIAILFDRKNRFLAAGLYDPYSPIRVRVLQAGAPAPIDAVWFKTRLDLAAARRKPLFTEKTNGFRMVHGENDGLPGLVVDRYDATLVIKLYTTAWVPHLADVMAGLTAVANPARIVLRLSRHVARLEEALFGLSNRQALIGAPLEGPVRFLENGLRFEADVAQGQKTGFFLDQRDNRARVEALAAGRRVLNVFAYTGGFSLYAARGGAVEVTSLDISAAALAGAERNFALNQSTSGVSAVRHATLLGDAFELLLQMGDAGRRFDLVVLDPPAFARKQSEVQRALAAYGRLTSLGLGVLQPGGVLVASSCSSRVNAEDFFQVVNQAARTARRPLREIERTGHAIDHPVGFSEGVYLKCLFAVAA